MTIPEKIAVLVLGCLVAGTTWALSPGQPVSPKQFFPSRILPVYAPDSEGWIVTGVASNGLSFGKRGAESTETYGAQAFVFEMPPTPDSGSFVDFVKKRIASMNPPPRFVETASDYQYDEDRTYPCVNVHITFDDTAALTPTGRQALKLQVTSRYCRHPVQKNLGFGVAYSHRGKTTDESMEGAARRFIEAISAPQLGSNSP